MPTVSINVTISHLKAAGFLYISRYIERGNGVSETSEMTGNAF